MDPSIQRWIKGFELTKGIPRIILPTWVSGVSPGGPQRATIRTHQNLLSEVPDLEDSLPAGHYLRTQSVRDACALLQAAVHTVLQHRGHSLHGH